MNSILQTSAAYKDAEPNDREINIKWPLAIPMTDAMTKFDFDVFQWRVQ